jgi:HAE1 family hydrophobic/amphiphilic exporter-1
VRELLESQAAVQGYRFENPTLFSVRTPVSVEVLCHDLDKLLVSSQMVMRKLGQLPALRDVRSTMSRGNTEVVVRFDREKLAQLGLDIGEASRRLGAMVQGEVPTRFAEREKKIDMRVRIDPQILSSVQELGRLNLSIASSTPILLRSVAELEFREGPSEIRRLGNLRGAEIQASAKGLDLGGVQEQVLSALSELPLPEGVELRLGGQREEMESSRSGMIGALLLAIFLVYVVMAAQFESLLQPFIILFTVPLALIGVVLALDLLGIAISVVVFIGAIMLAGIVVNNAIVLVDRINQERAAGKELQEAILDGAALRLRPVLMTTATTVLGLLPLTGWIPALPIFGTAGEGIELRAPMAITVVTGLLFATLLTLLFIPVIYRLLGASSKPPILRGAKSPARSPARSLAMSELLSRLVSRPVLAFMVAATILVLGLIANLRIPVTMLPEGISRNRVNVWIQVSNLTPQEAEEDVYEPFENELLTIPGVTKVMGRCSSRRVFVAVETGPQVDTKLAAPKCATACTARGRAGLRRSTAGACGARPTRRCR